MSNLQALLERVEAASGPDRDLDWTMAQAFDPDLAGRVLITYEGSKAACIANGLWPKRKGACWRDALFSVPRYTASLDAAVGLVEKMLPGWTWGINGPDPELDGECVGSLWKSTANTIDGDGKTPALALIAALLKALISQSNPERPGVE